MQPGEAIEILKRDLGGFPVRAGGGLFFANQFGCAFGDADGFPSSFGGLMISGQHLLDLGYVMDEANAAIWDALVQFGTGGWHTNSVKFQSREGLEVNLIYKTVNKAPIAGQEELLLTFDASSLTIGLDLEYMRWVDLRKSLWPDMDPDGPLPMAPGKRFRWRAGKFQYYEALRQPTRWTRFTERMDDINQPGFFDLVADDLVAGYRFKAPYLLNHRKEKKRYYGAIFTVIADLLEDRDIAGLKQAYESFEFEDPIDRIYDAFLEGKVVM